MSAKIHTFPSKQRVKSSDPSLIFQECVEECMSNWVVAHQKNRVNELVISKLPEYAIPRDVHDVFLNLASIAHIEKKLKMRFQLVIDHVENVFQMKIVYNQLSLMIEHELLQNEVQLRSFGVYCFSLFTLRMMIQQ